MKQTGRNKCTQMPRVAAHHIAAGCSGAHVFSKLGVEILRGNLDNLYHKPHISDIVQNNGVLLSWMTFNIDNCKNK